MIASVRSLFTGLMVFALAAGLRSQEVEVKNVRFKQAKDSKVLVNYDLFGDASQKYLITLAIFRPDTKETVPLGQKNLAGDIGNNVRAGRGKKIIWDLLKDFPNGLHGEGYVFTIDADAQKGRSKWPWVLGGLIISAGGAAAYFLAKDIGEEADLPGPPTRFPDPPGGFLPHL